MHQKNLTQFALAAVIVMVGISARFLPHPYNFSPIAAIALFSGVYFSKKIALTLPIIILAISDIFLGSYEIGLMATVYGCFIVNTLIGFWLKNHKKWHTVIGSAIVGSILFYIVTNFAVWAFAPWYQKTMLGLQQSYINALPFFRNTVLGDLFYVSIFFALYEPASQWLAKKMSQKHTQTTIA